MRKASIAVVLVLLAALPMTIARIVFLEPRPELTYEGVTFRPDDTRAGILQAFDAKTGQLLWEKRLYDHFMQPLLEADVQWKYVEGIFLDKEKNRLFVMNDAGTLIALDILSKEANVFERGRDISVKIVKREDGGQDFDELQVLHGDKVLLRFPGVGSEE